MASCMMFLDHETSVGLKALVAEQGEESSLGDFCLEKLYSFVGEGWEQEDDITLLTLRRSPSLS